MKLVRKHFLALALFLVAVAAFAFLVMFLWNALLPEIFGLQEIAFWQAAGILVLSRLLFGGMGGWHGHRHKRHFHGKWSEHGKGKWHGVHSCCGNEAPTEKDETAAEEK